MGCRLIYIALLLFSGIVCAATPTVSNVSGTVSTGQTLTVTGSALIDDVKTNWDTGSANCGNQEPNFTTGTSYGFEGSSAANDCYGTGTSETGSTVSYSSTVKVAGNNSIKFHIQGQHTDTIAHNPRASAIVYNTQGLSGYYVRTYARWDLNAGSWPSAYMKMFWTTSSGGETFFMQPNITTQICVLDGWIDGCTPFTGNGGGIQSGRWYALEWHVHPNGDVLEGWIDNTRISVTGNYSGTTGWFEFGFINLNGTTSAFNIDHYMDNLAISSSRIYPATFVEIGNSSNYSTATKVTQPVAYFSDGTTDTAQITADLTGLGAGPYYLWVTNNGQERSAAYSLSGGADTTPPVISAPLPSGEQAYGTSSVTLQVTTNENATCKYHTSDVSYASMSNTFGSTGGTTHQQTGFSVSNGQNYTRYVRCIDGSGNASAASTAISFSVAASAPTANLLFSESFEDASWSSRGWYDSSAQGSIVAGGQSGNALEWAWTAGQQRPSNGTAIRNAFTATDEMFVTVYLKFASTWRGSQQNYHPHMIYLPSNLDDDYAAMAETYLNTYIEVVSDIGSPDEIRPQTALQDSLRVNTSYGTPPIDITAITENRSVNYCNGYLAGQDSGSLRDCYSTGGSDYFSATIWRGTNEIPKNQWVKVETYFKMNSISGGVAQPDGIMKQWIDGVLWLDKSNIVYRTNQDATKEWNKIVLAPYIGDTSPITQTMWVDELKIYDGIPGATDTTPPAVTIATADPSTISADSLTVTGTASDAVGVSGCKWRVGSAPDSGNGTACTGTTSFSCATSGYSEGANTLYVGCYDAAGNYGSDSITVNRDSIAPTTPTDMDARSDSTSTVDLSWGASTDTVGVTSYRVDYCSGFNCSSWATLGTSATNAYTHTGITPAANPTIYRYRVYALDAANNLSGAATSIYFNAVPTIPAFPGAEGGGASSKGGRGGTIYHVTSLSGGTEAGTLRACAVVATGPRTCVFDVSGNIELTSHVNISNPYLTIAGNTAPGGGITISGKNSTAVTFTVRTHNVTIRYLRMRKGYNAGTPSQDGDAANVAGVSATSGPIGPIIFDHVSASWGQDENAEMWSDVPRSPKNITYQWSMIYEPLLAHPVNFMTGAYASSVADNMTDIDLHHSILANSSHRNPMIKNRSFRFVNSLTYNWSDWALAVHGTGQVDIIGNKFKTGPLYLTESAKAYEIEATPIGNSTTATTGTMSLYVTGNVGPHNSDPLADNWVMTRLIDIEANGSAELGALSESYRRLTPLPALPFPITAHDVGTAETIVLAGAGASRRLDCSGNWVSNRDSADTRVVAEYTAGNAGIVPTNEDAVGGYPTLAAGTACTDTDSDGIPDTYETAKGLNPNSSSDGVTAHATGYTNLEMYLSGTGGDLTPPVLSGVSPTGSQASVVSSIALALTTDEAANCRYDLNGVSDYDSMTNYTSTGGTSHSATVTVLPGRVYAPAAKCRDAAGNTSASPAWRFAVPSPKRRRLWR